MLHQNIYISFLGCDIGDISPTRKCVNLSFMNRSHADKFYEDHEFEQREIRRTGVSFAGNTTTFWTAGNDKEENETRFVACVILWEICDNFYIGSLACILSVFV